VLQLLEFRGEEFSSPFFVETPIPKANNLKVTIGVAELVSCNETQASETKCAEACRSNYPQSGGYNTPQLAAESVSKACLGFIPVINHD